MSGRNKVLAWKEIMDIVVSTIYFIKNVLIHWQIKKVLAYVKAEYDDMIYYCEV